MDKPISGSVKLTDYVKGIYYNQSVPYEFYLNTKTKEMYVSEGFEDLQTFTGQQILQSLGLSGKAEFDYISIDPLWLSNAYNPDERPDTNDLHVYYENVLPIGTRFEEYFAGPNRQTIHPLCQVRVDDTVDLQNYTMEDFDFSAINTDVLYLVLYNSTQRLEYRQDEHSSGHPAVPKLDYSGYEQILLENMTVLASVQRTYKEGDTDLSCTYSAEDFRLEQTENGISVTVENLRELKPMYSLVTDDEQFATHTFNNNGAYWKLYGTQYYLTYLYRIYLPVYYKENKDYTVETFRFNKTYVFTTD